jgi:hypothetical protein
MNDGIFFYLRKLRLPVHTTSLYVWRALTKFTSKHTWGQINPLMATDEGKYAQASNSVSKLRLPLNWNAVAEI